MEKKGYILFGLMITVGFYLISFSFSRHQSVLVSQFIVGFIMALIGIIGCVLLDHIGKAGDRHGSYLSAS